jgi:hypothetical protein
MNPDASDAIDRIAGAVGDAVGVAFSELAREGYDMCDLLNEIQSVTTNACLRAMIGHRIERLNADSDTGKEETQ